MSNCLGLCSCHCCGIGMQSGESLGIDHNRKRQRQHGHHSLTPVEASGVMNGALSVTLTTRRLRRSQQGKPSSAWYSQTSLASERSHVSSL